MSVRTTPRAGASVAVVGLVAVAALAGTAAPADAAPASAAPASASGTSCPSGTLSVSTLRSGCTTSDGTVRLSDGRTFAIPARGASVVALSVAAAGATEPSEVVVANTGRAGVAVRVGDAWQGAPAAVRQQRSAISAVTGSTGAHTVGTGSAATTGTRAAASTKCTSTANVQTRYRWSSAVRWYYNATGSKGTYAQSALQKAANAWTGKISSCGKTVTSTAGNTFVRTVTQVPDVTATGGCSASSGSSVTGWGALPARTLGVTCVWYDQNGVVKEADQRYSTKYAWSSTASCSGSRYDVQAVATHEWGHLYGLGHVASGTGQVMEKSEGPCALGSRTLGLGDMTGIAAKY
ncbi:hypothetical protein [Curtobacterium sp. NPDC089689]|uniref:hypothetical protein n=1 Tax=Curtobacterium sp. NPDC089689 TaxID=3363968 RepID=UPI00381ED044